MEKPSPKKKHDDNDICRDILLYGKDILNSGIFRQAALQTHHLHGTVFDHTINVCVVSIRLCYQLMDRGIDVCEKDLVQAALCHDLGMVFRESKYTDVIDSWKNHPRESARIARDLIPDLSEKAEEMILSHMWPLAGSPPASNEGMLLCMADKYASMADWKSWLTKTSYAKRIKDLLYTDKEAEKSGSEFLD